MMLMKPDLLILDPSALPLLSPLDLDTKDTLKLLR
jgi:hypothetical protein